MACSLPAKAWKVGRAEVRWGAQMAARSGAGDAARSFEQEDLATRASGARTRAVLHEAELRRPVPANTPPTYPNASRRERGSSDADQPRSSRVQMPASSTFTGNFGTGS